MSYLKTLALLMLKFIVHIEVQVCKNLIKPLDSAFKDKSGYGVCW